MTPLEVMVLVKLMRDAQKRWPDHPQQVSIDVLPLERAVDEAIEPYIEHAKQVAWEHQQREEAGHEQD